MRGFFFTASLQKNSVPQRAEAKGLAHDRPSSRVEGAHHTPRSSHPTIAMLISRDVAPRQPEFAGSAKNR
jgi:hypothetical protein